MRYRTVGTNSCEVEEMEIFAIVGMYVCICMYACLYGFDDGTDFVARAHVDRYMACMGVK